MTTPRQRRAFLKKLSLEQAIVAAVTQYAAAVVTQLKLANAAGGWPEKLILKEPENTAEREAFNLVFGNLQKQLPDTKILLTPSDG